MYRTKKIIIIATCVAILFLITLGILLFLLLNTDVFKSNEVLFSKYFVQNFDLIEFLKVEENTEIETLVNNNKYTSKIDGNVEYTQDIETSTENKNSPINNIGIKINSSIDKINNYEYRDVNIGSNNKNLLGFEYINENENYGIRLDGIKQFVSSDLNDINKILNNLQIDNIENLTSEINFKEILNFSNEEKQNLIDTYLEILKKNITKDKYFKQQNSLITINNQDVQANSYYIKFTIEEYNNLLIKILDQIAQDEIILSRIDLIENEIKEKYSNYNSSESLRNLFIDKINEKIEEIKNSNIGNDEVRITIYEKDQKLVRTSIEKSQLKITIDKYDESTIKINKTEVENTTSEQSLTIKKDLNTNIYNFSIEYDYNLNNENVNMIKFDYTQMFENNEINRMYTITMLNENNESIINLTHDIEFVQDFEEKITLEANNVDLKDLPEDKLEIILDTINSNIEEQLKNLSSKVKLDDYTDMLRKFQIIKSNPIEIPTQPVVSDTERKRFNSQFEFFASQNLTSDNIKELLEVVKENLEDIKVLLKTEEIEDLDTEKSNTLGQNDYKESISEILLYIKEDTNNENKRKDTIDFIENNNNVNKYDVVIEYDDDNLVRLIRIQIQED